MFSTFKPEPSQTIQTNSIPNALFAPTFPSPEISFLSRDSGCSQNGEVECKFEQKTGERRRILSPGLAEGRERVKFLLFTRVGQNGSVVRKKNSGKLRGRILCWILLLNINVLTVRCNISWRGIFARRVGREGDRVWRWEKKSSLRKKKTKQAKPYICLPLHILDLGMEQDFGIEDVLEMPRC